MRATLSYSLGRLLLFVAALGLMYLAGARGLLLVGLALLISGIISFVVLSRLRDAMSGAITSRTGNFRKRLDEGSRAEDDDDRAGEDDAVSVSEPASAGPDVHP
jgi:hypothetical protein